MQQTVVRYDGKFLDSQSLPVVERTVKAATLLPKGSGLERSASALFVRFGTRIYAVMLNQQVPEGSTLVRDTQGKICGIPAVAGGSGIPRWKDMPSPRNILTLRWEDVYAKAAEHTEEKLDRKPRRKEIRDIFILVATREIDCENDTYWGRIEHYVGEYYGRE